VRATAWRSLRSVAALLPYLGVAGLILGPTGIVWTFLNWRTDDTGKRITQAGEIVVMLQSLIRELESSLHRCEAALHASKAETEAAERELSRCQAHCLVLQRELDTVRSQLARLLQGEAT